MAIGDCHAIMGDGEVCVTGCEIAAEVTLKVDLIKGKATTWPLLETDKYTMVIASGDTLEEATFNATNQTVEYLQKSLMLSWEDAYILSSLLGDKKISQVVNPKKTVRAAIPKFLVKTDLLIDSICETRLNFENYINHRNNRISNQKVKGINEKKTIL